MTQSKYFQRLAIGLMLTITAYPAAAANDSAAAGHSPDAPYVDDKWVPFMQQHFIDRSALKFRHDGLLQSATIYPRTSRSGWTAEQNANGWRERIDRVIDCDTGLFVNVRSTLLGRDGRPVASHAIDLEDQLQQIALREDDVMRHEWPSRSEIAMACALARQPHAKDIGELKIGGRSFAKSGARYDLPAIGDAPPPTNKSLFARLQRQYDTYLATFSEAIKGKSTRRVLAPDESGKRWIEINKSPYLSGDRFDLTSMKYADGHMQIIGDLSGYQTDRSANFDRRKFELRQNFYIDCRTGLTIPVEDLVYDKKSHKPIRQTPTPVFATMTVISERLGTWYEWLGPQEEDPAAKICRIAAAQCHGASPPDSTTFEINPADLPNEGGAPLVLAAHRIWLKHRATYVPSCTIGGH